MKMLIIVFRDSLDEDIRRLLKDLDVKAFTETPRVVGTGEAGSAFDSLEWPGSNSMIFAAMDEQQAEQVVKGLKAFHDRLKQQQHGAKIPMRVFVLPCEWAV